jgi:UDP-N-acetylglucosamine transferase subunit ALG13
MPVRKHSVLFVVRDGGGTASVELTVAAKLRERGHVVRLFGPPEVADRCSACVRAAVGPATGAGPLRGPAASRHVGGRSGPCAATRRDRPTRTDQPQHDRHGPAGLLQRIIDAVAGLPVRGLVTIGPVDGGRLRVPGNVAVERFVPHDQVLPDVRLVVTHAGHGTVMASIAAGVPLVCIPMGRDQPAVADRVAHHGLGVAVDPTTDVVGLRRAVRRVLDAAAYRCTTQRIAAEFEPRGLVVTEIEQALSRSRTLTENPAVR